jgi:hypothetical protein
MDSLTRGMCFLSIIRSVFSVTVQMVSKFEQVSICIGLFKVKIVAIKHSGAPSRIIYLVYIFLNN